MTDQLGGTQRPGLRQTSAGGLGFLRRVISGVGVLVLSSISPLVAEVATQTDWSKGAEETGTVSVWDRSFAEAQGISWLKLFWNDGGDPLAWRDEDIGDAIVTPLVLGAGDLDGDGDMDVAVTSDAWNRVIWWRNNGGPPADWPSTTVAPMVRAIVFEWTSEVPSRQSLGGRVYP